MSCSPGFGLFCLRLASSPGGLRRGIARLPHRSVRALPLSNETAFVPTIVRSVDVPGLAPGAGVKPS